MPSVTQPAEELPGGPLPPLDPRDNPAPVKRRRIRWNILVLVGWGYTVCALAFVGMIYSGDTGTAAWDAIKEILSVLVGGSLALAKDVLKSDDDPTP